MSAADETAKSPVGHGARLWRPQFDIWTAGALIIALLVAAPLIAVGWIALFPRENIWPHLIATALPRYLGNTLILMALVGLGSAMIGTGAAWLVTMKRFPLRGLFDWALLAPLAVPAYIGAYSLVELLEYAGPVQTGLREIFGWRDARDYWFPEIRSIWSAAFVLTLSLYPYVFLMARSAFREQSVCALEVSRSLGSGPWSCFFRVALPLARPAVVVGAAIAMMETLNDFGAVDYFAVPTLTAGVFAIWMESSNVGGAAQISSVMLLFVLALIGLERAARRGRRYHNMSRRYRPIVREEMSLFWRWAAFVGCAIPLSLGFIAPVGVILWRAIGHLDQWLEPAFWGALANTAWLAGVAAMIAAGSGLFLVYGARSSRSALPRRLGQAATIGYAAPGAVLAVGVIVPAAALDRVISGAMSDWFGVATGLILTGSAAAVIYAYVARFSAIAYGAIDGAFGRVTPSMEMAARTLGESKGGALRRVHLPIIKGSVLTAALLIFVDASKELPATLILRPFDFDTLATRVYTYASLEQLEQAAPAALAIILVGLAPVAILIRTVGSYRPGVGQDH